MAATRLVGSVFGGRLDFPLASFFSACQLLFIVFAIFFSTIQIVRHVPKPSFGDHLAEHCSEFGAA
jgi:hypothetical protein